MQTEYTRFQIECRRWFIYLSQHIEIDFLFVDLFHDFGCKERREGALKRVIR